MPSCYFGVTVIKVIYFGVKVMSKSYKETKIFLFENTNEFSESVIKLWLVVRL